MSVVKAIVGKIIGEEEYRFKFCCIYYRKFMVSRPWSRVAPSSSLIESIRKVFSGCPCERVASYFHIILPRRHEDLYFWCSLSSIWNVQYIEILKNIFRLISIYVLGNRDKPHFIGSIPIKSTK